MDINSNIKQKIIFSFNIFYNPLYVLYNILKSLKLVRYDFVLSFFLDIIILRLYFLLQYNENNSYHYHKSIYSFSIKINLKKKINLKNIMSLKLSLFIHIVISILQYIAVIVNIYNLYNTNNKIFSSIFKKKNFYLKFLFKISYIYLLNI